MQATLQQALVHHQNGQLAQAQTLYESVLKVQPLNFDCLHLLGILAYQTNRPQMAVELISKAIKINSKVAHPFINIGLALQALRRPDEALVNYDKAIALDSKIAEAHNNRGNALTDLKRLDEALISYDKAIALKPQYAEAYNNRGTVLYELKRLDEVLVNCDKAITLRPDFAEAYSNRGNALKDLKRLDEALVSYAKAIALQPNFAEAYNNCGTALKDLKRLDEALASYAKAIALKPDYAQAYYNRGTALKEFNRPDEALVNCDKAIALKPDYAEAYVNRGDALKDLDRLEDALSSYNKAIALKPDIEFLLGDLLFTKKQLCDWQDLDERLKHYEVGINSSRKITQPFPALSLLDSPELHKQVAKIYAATFFPKIEYLGTIKKRIKNEKIRVGYYSADFHNHPVAYLTAGLFELHSRNRFEIYGFSYGPDTHDDMRQRVAAAFDQFVDVKDMSDAQVVTLSRELGIDIAIDLGGYTQNSRTGLFALGCAPVQVSYLGFPGTMGADYIDYVIADTTVIPVAQQAHFTEKIVYMPHSFQVNDSRRKSSDRVFLRQELGLPESGVVFCCFNNSYKIGPSTFDVWMRILKAVEGSVLWLLDDHPTTVKNLRKEAVSRGIEEGRLVFAGRMAYGDYLARYRSADLFLDTLPYNAGTTASDALWAGLPVLTCMGQSFASRMAASLLTALELPELITHTQAEYEAKAIELALKADKQAEIKRQLEKNRFTTPLFDTALFAKHIESAYAAMYDRYRAGLAPENINVKAHG